MAIQSAGLLLFRHGETGLEVLLAHPGGPFWARKNVGAWSIPKGEIGDGEDAFQAARREFEEETGYKPKGQGIALGSARQRSGKVVLVWAIRDDWDPRALVSNVFRMEWPRRSGRIQEFPEIDQASWMTLGEARANIVKGQAVFLDRLQAVM